MSVDVSLDRDDFCANFEEAPQKRERYVFLTMTLHWFKRLGAAYTTHYCPNQGGYKSTMRKCVTHLTSES